MHRRTAGASSLVYGRIEVRGNSPLVQGVRRQHRARAVRLRGCRVEHFGSPRAAAVERWAVALSAPGSQAFDSSISRISEITVCPE